MKQSTKTVTFTGIAGAVAVAGASQAYGTVINVATAEQHHRSYAEHGEHLGREYWNARDRRKTTTTNPGT